MSWLSDIGESVLGVTTDYKLADQESWLKPLISLGTGALKQSNVDNSQSQYLDYLKQREMANYQKSLADINAYNAQLAMVGGGSGGGGGGSGAGAAAANATEANRMKAAKKANKFSQNTYKELLKIYEPYRKTADTLLPQMTATYQDSLAMQNSMMKYLQQPGQMAKLDANTPAWMVNVPLPDSVRLK